MLSKLYLAGVFLSALASLAAQAPPSAEGGIPTTLWIGASVSTFNPDYGCPNSSPFSCGEYQLIGIVPHLDTSSFLFRRIGAEAEARLMLWHGPIYMVQYSYLGGPRVRLVRFRDVLVTGKFLLGLAHLDVSPGLGDGSYFAYAPGAAVDYRFKPFIAARIDYEYQRWPEYPCFRCSNPGSGGLTPNGFSFGISYAIHKSGTEPNPN